MSVKIRLGIIGGGGDSLIGILHRVASSMFDKYEVVGGVFNPNWEENIVFANKLGLNENRVYKDFDTFIAEETKLPIEKRIQVVSVLTPNFLHFQMANDLLENGFHVICEKPMTTTYERSKNIEYNPAKSKNSFRGNIHLYWLSDGASNARNDFKWRNRKGSKNRCTILSRLDQSDNS